jgi:poly(3-hydroxybutyrate) depolymerase
MIYHLYQAQTEALALLRTAARIGSRAVWDTVMPAPSSLALRCHGALCDLIVGTSLSHERPQFAIGPVHVGNRAVDVVEEITAETPYATLLRFRKDTGVSQPRVLLVAPLSGHFATLLRGTVQVMLPDHDLYITDWKNARDIPLSKGRFGLDEFVDHVV